jgi:hypothetical protein
MVWVDFSFLAWALVIIVQLGIFSFCWLTPISDITRNVSLLINFRYCSVIVCSIYEQSVMLYHNLPVFSYTIPRVLWRLKRQMELQ